MAHASDSCADMCRGRRGVAPLRMCHGPAKYAHKTHAPALTHRTPDTERVKSGGIRAATASNVVKGGPLSATLCSRTRLLLHLMQDMHITADTGHKCSRDHQSRYTEASKGKQGVVLKQQLAKPTSTSELTCRGGTIGNSFAISRGSRSSRPGCDRTCVLNQICRAAKMKGANKVLAVCWVLGDPRHLDRATLRSAKTATTKY